MVNGTLIKKGNIWHVVFHHKGKQRWKTTGEKSRTKAARRMQEILEPLSKAGDATALMKAAEEAMRESREMHGATVRISEMWDIFSSAPERSDCKNSTLKDYGSIWNRFTVWCRTRDIVSISQVTSFEAADYTRVLMANLGANTYNKHVNILQHVWKTLGKRTGWELNPWRNISRKKFQVISRNELSLDQIRSLLAVSSGEYRTLILLGLYTGMRRKDCVLLRWQDVYIADRMIKVMPFKTMRSKKTIIQAAIPDELMRALEGSANRTGFVLPMLSDMYAHKYQTFNRRIAELFDKADIKRVQQEIPEGHIKKPIVFGFHSLRHSFVSICRRNGVPESFVQSIVGHSNPAMTRHYTHVADEAAQLAASVLPNISEMTEKRERPPQWVVSELKKMNAATWEEIRELILSAG